MKSMRKWLVAAGVATAMCLMSNSSVAQDNGNANGGGGGGRRGGGNFDPAQMRQRMLDRYKETLEVTKDDEWQALQPRIEKVMDARTGTFGGMGRGMMGGRRTPNGGGTNGDANAQGNQTRRARPGATPMPEAEALQKAIDDKVAASELKTVLAKYLDARKSKQDQLKTAQEDLRKLLTPRQEAIASLNGLL